MGVRIGIDAGSKTIKVVVIDEQGAVLRSSYRRHLSNIGSTLSHVLSEMVEEEGDVCGPVAFTGSAGIALAEAFGVPHVQEVVAATDAVRALHPDADAFVELGGEDAKIVYLKDGLEQRMNTTCAGGTGGFIDIMAGMLGVRAADMNRLAAKARRTYLIASRCAVFAQTDVRPLLNSGADPSDVAASVLDAVVRQTLGGLACGRRLEGTIVFLGGPLEHIPALVDRFRAHLHLDESTGVKPRGAHLYAAYGSALGASTTGFAASLSSLAEASAMLQLPDDGLSRLGPLFEDEREIRDFKRRHSALRWPRAPLRECQGPLFAGFDAGSTTVKVAVLDVQGRLVHSECRPARGNSFSIASAMLARIWQKLPEGARIARSAATGYGEDLLKAGLGVDDGIVETIAHAQAAMWLRPDVSVVLDIGGQDMKALWIRDGRVVESVLNEACSSGCGAFLEGTSYALGSSPDVLAASALRARAPIDLGTRCTVFMTSRVRHAQKIGASLSDIGAGLAYSVVGNVLNRITALRRAWCLDGCMMVQGGAFRSDAVLRAFELRLGAEVVRPDVSHLMGAIGAALAARRHWDECAGADGGVAPVSRLLDADSLRSLAVKRFSMPCSGCDNSCLLSVVEFGNGRSAVSGNRCSRGVEVFCSARGSDSGARHAVGNAGAPNVVRLQQKLLMRVGAQGETDAAGVRIGLITALSGYESQAFWRAFFDQLGFCVVVPRVIGNDEPSSHALESIVSDGVCYAAKQANAELFELAAMEIDVAFMPRFARGSRCAVLCGYAETLSFGLSDVSCAGIPLMSPFLPSPHIIKNPLNSNDAKVLQKALGRFSCSGNVLDEDALRRAWDVAVAAQRAFEHKIEEASRRALLWLEGNRSRQGVILACRPYHVAPRVLHGIDEMLADLGIAVIPPLGARVLEEEAANGACAEGVDVGAKDEASWAGSKRLVRLAAAVAGHPRLQAVFLRSFGCTIDAVALDEARSIVEDAGKPFTVLEMDEIVDRVHVGIRLKTLAQTLSQEGSFRISKRREPSYARATALPVGERRTDTLTSWMNLSTQSILRLPEPRCPGMHASLHRLLQRV